MDQYPTSDTGDSGRHKAQPLRQSGDLGRYEVQGREVPQTSSPQGIAPTYHQSDAEFWSYAREQANRTYRAPSVSSQEYLQCELGIARCLLPLTALYEVVLPPHRFVRLPATPSWMPGIVAWRGETIAGIDLAAYLATRSVGAAPCACPSWLTESAERGVINQAPTPETGVMNYAPTLEGTLLIVHAADVVVGLLVPAIGLTVPVEEIQQLSEDERNSLPVRAEVVRGRYEHAFLLDVPLLLADVVQQIGSAASNG